MGEDCSIDVPKISTTTDSVINDTIEKRSGKHFICGVVEGMSFLFSNSILICYLRFLWKTMDKRTKKGFVCQVNYLQKNICFYQF